MDKDELEKKMFHEYYAILAARSFGKTGEKNIKNLERLIMTAEEKNYNGLAIFFRGKVRESKDS
jgi:hypothetical protein